MIVLEGSFYGRTYRPARLSHSCRETYQKHLASFQHADCHLPLVVPANDVAALHRAFEHAEKSKLHVEAMYMEPVMGEGNPGETISRPFYDAARTLTKQHHSLLIVDSIQAALRAKGSLSIVDYPGFADADAPDMETYSKALNAGQFPLSGACVAYLLCLFATVQFHCSACAAGAHRLQVRRWPLWQHDDDQPSRTRHCCGSSPLRDSSRAPEHH